METRSIVKSGPSSYVVSLPLKWIKSNRLRKGDNIFIEEKDNKIICSSSAKSEDPERSFRIDASSTKDVLERMLKSAYLGGYHTFILEGEVKNKAKEFREIIDQLVAVEIMEQGGQRIIAHELLDKSKNSPDKILKRIDMIIRGMFEDLASENGLYQNFVERDKDVNRLHLLAERLVLHAYSNPGYAEEVSLTGFNIVLDTKALDFLEIIADGLKECSKVSDLQKRNKELIGKLRKRYLEVMDAYYKRDAKAAVSCSCKTKEALSWIEEYPKTVQGIEFIMPLRTVILMLDELSLVILNKST
ncbi:MAG: hypothetical protein HGA85_05600 [Nanoarchaeota archaeon]|nr:hypothetical protein [Nanoarchaeota archaeon]